MACQVTDKTDWLILPLKKPLHHGEREITQLEIRPITTDDMEALGRLYTVGVTAESVNVDIKQTIRYLSRLCALPPSVIKQMSPFELDQAGWQLFNFFVNS